MEPVIKKGNIKESITNLSNMVFGVALSIGALTLINNISSIANSGAIINNIITFAFSFLIIISIWFRYTKALALMKVETRIEINLNIVILFLVAVEPYLFYLLNIGTGSLVNFTSILYALDVAGLLIVLSIFYKIGIWSHKTENPEIKDYYGPVGNALLFSGILFLVSALPIFWGINVFGFQLRFVIWIVALILGNSLRNLDRYIRRRAANSA